MLEIEIDKLLGYINPQNGNILARIEDLFKGHKGVAIVLNNKYKLEFLSTEVELFYIWLMIVKHRIK